MLAKLLQIYVVLTFCFNIVQGSNEPPSPTSDGDPRINRHRRFEARRNLTPCQLELRSGRYQSGIAAQFPPLSNGRPSVIGDIREEETNLFCICATATRMLCSISCRSAEIQRIVNRRLDAFQPADQLHPFFFARFSSNSGLFYHHPETRIRTVMAEIIVYPYLDQESQIVPLSPRSYHPMPMSGPITISWPIQRSHSSPGLLPRTPGANRAPPSPQRKRSRSSPPTVNTPDKEIDLFVCTGGTLGVACPITLNEFEIGQTVYILKRDAEKVAEGKSVGCISSEGLRKTRDTIANLAQGGFEDPLRRTGNDILTIRHDFDVYIIKTDKYGSEVPSPLTPSQGEASSSNQAGSSEEASFNLQNLSESLPEPEVGSPLKTSNHHSFHVLLFGSCFTLLFYQLHNSREHLESANTKTYLL